MQAIVRIEPGVAQVREVAEPVAGDGVLVQMRYAAVNPFDAQVLRGEIGADPSRELILGAEGAGTVNGAWVHVSGGGLGVARDGTFAELITVPESSVHALPAGIDPRAAATVGVAGKTAWRAVRQLANVGPDDVVLVLGATGGVGTFALQLASACGAVVLAHTGASDKSASLARYADDVLVAQTPDELAALVAGRDVSVVLDPLGGDYLARLLPVLAPRARAITYGVLAGRTTTLDLGTLYAKGITVLGTSGGTTPPAEAAAALDGVLAAVAARDLVIDTELIPLADGLSAFERLAARAVSGKLLLEV